MTDQISRDLERPEHDRAPDGQRDDGRPSQDTIDDVRSGGTEKRSPTEAPEEKGTAPSTEHGPGGDL